MPKAKITEIEEEEHVKVVDNFSEYMKAKLKHEKTWFKLISPACYVREEKNGEISLKNATDTKHIFEHQRVTVIQKEKSKSCSFFDLWKIDPKIRVYDNLVFKPFPLKIEPDEYNIFKGFPITTGKLVPIDEFTELLKSLTAYEEKSTKYLTAYLADLVQNPGLQNRSHGKCIIFRSDQGCGKGTFFAVMQRVLGHNLVNLTSDMNSIIKSSDNKFACGAVNKLLVVFEEVQSNDGYSKADQLKDYITNPEIEQEIKSINGTIKHKSFARFLAFTNHANSIKIESSDRRYVMFHASDKYVGDHSFWSTIYSKMQDNDYIYSIYHYLNTYDIKKFDFQDRPITAAYNRAKANAVPYVIRFLADRAMKDKKSHRYSISELFELFDVFLKQNKFKHEMTKPAFQAELKELVKKKIGLYTIKNSVIKYYVEKPELQAYCTKNKFDVFDAADEEPETPEPEEEDPLENGVDKTEQTVKPKQTKKPTPKQFGDGFKSKSKPEKLGSKGLVKKNVDEDNLIFDINE